MAAAGGLCLIIAVLVWGGLSLTVTLALADSTQIEFNWLPQASPQIVVLACPSNPGISFTPTNPDANETVEFSTSITPPGGGGVITLTWNFGDGSAEQTGQTIEHAYSFDGVYTVTLTATGDACASPPTATKQITVGTGIAPASIIYLPLMFKNYPSIIFPTGSSPVTVITAPQQVAGLTGFVDQGKIYLSWNASPPIEAVHHYQIYRYQQGVDEVFELWGVMPSSSTTFTDATAACGAAYYITAVNAAGESASSTATYFSPACAY
jgi:PKD repeat protein